jgi:hypothetical protein
MAEGFRPTPQYRHAAGSIHKCIQLIKAVRHFCGWRGRDASARLLVVEDRSIFLALPLLADPDSTVWC